MLAQLCDVTVFSVYVARFTSASANSSVLALRLKQWESMQTQYKASADLRQFSGKFGALRFYWVPGLQVRQ